MLKISLCLLKAKAAIKRVALTAPNYRSVTRVIGLENPVKNQTVWLSNL